MSDLVVASSVAIKWFVVEPYSTEARRILTDYQAGILTFHAPDLINAEIGNIVWKKQRFHGVAQADAQAIIDVFRTLTIVRTPTADLLDTAYRLAVLYQCTVYDMLYVALSIREACPMVTADEKLVHAIGRTFPNIIWLGQWP
ncbi:MAG TPA: type II toxin-antitoxin system VapC family toxin [Roseiflexaceae bacterium]|nr:type II toxin-antitoxin system VapC family toxin [Roseiflexaceae bacterium]